VVGNALIIKEETGMKTQQNSISEWWDTFVGRKNRKSFAIRQGFTPFEADNISVMEWVNVPTEWKHKLLTHAS
jgi:hypothetical protein